MLNQIEKREKPKKVHIAMSRVATVPCVLCQKHQCKTHYLLAPKSRIKGFVGGEIALYENSLCLHEGLCLSPFILYCHPFSQSIHCSHLHTQLLLTVCSGYYLLCKLSPRSLHKSPFLQFYKHWFAKVLFCGYFSTLST